MGDIQYWKDAIITEIEQIQVLKSSLANRPEGFERTAGINEAEKKIRNAKNNCRALKGEIRIIADPDESSRYKKELANFEQSLAQFSADIQGLKSESNRNQLFLNANTGGDNNVEETDPFRNGDLLLDGAENIQDKTQGALENTKFMINEAKTTGMLTLEELERQRQQISSVDQHVGRMEDNLNRADKLIKTFGKRMATDKLIQCFACVNILLIVGVVVYSIVKGGIGNNEEQSPQNPVGTRMLRGN